MRDHVAPAPAPGEAGFTLVELLVSMTIFLAVLAVTLGVLTDVSRGVKKDEARTQAAADAQVGVARMVRELRAAYDVNAMSGTLMDVSARLNGQNVRLQYDCAAPFTPDDPKNPFDQYYTRCVRRTAPITDPNDPLVTLPAAGTVIVDRLCAGTSTTTCAAASVFKCRATAAAASSDCAQLPDPPVDPDYPPDPTDPAPDPVFPTLVEINVQVPARGGSREAIYSHRITVNDGVLLRNVEAGYALNS